MFHLKKRFVKIRGLKTHAAEMQFQMCMITLWWYWSPLAAHYLNITRTVLMITAGNLIKTSNGLPCCNQNTFTPSMIYENSSAKAFHSPTDIPPSCLYLWALSNPNRGNLSIDFKWECFFIFFLWAQFNESWTVYLYSIGKIRIKGGSKRKRESVIKVLNSWKNSDIKEGWYKRLVSVLWTHMTEEWIDVFHLSIER